MCDKLSRLAPHITRWLQSSRKLYAGHKALLEAPSTQGGCGAEQERLL
jgi:hypothetical protein